MSKQSVHIILFVYYINGMCSLNVPVYNTFLDACGFYDLSVIIQNNSIQLNDNSTHAHISLSYYAVKHNPYINRNFSD